jgi:hypothetical protein
MAGKTNSVRRAPAESARLSAKIHVQAVSSASAPPRKVAPQTDKKSLPSLQPQSKPITKPVFTSDEQKVCSLVTRAMTVDGSGAEARVLLLRSICLFLNQHKLKLSVEAVRSFIELFTAVLSGPLPFTLVQKGYRQFFFKPAVMPDDVAICYDLFGMVDGGEIEYPVGFLRALVRRLTSAAPDDRVKAKECLAQLGPSYYCRILHLIRVILSPAPPHGVDVLLECVAKFLDESTFYDSDLWNQLELVLHLLHLAPHLRSFHKELIAALKALHEKDGDIAHRSRRFLLNNWPRIDPQRAVLFMQEASAICVHGPRIEYDVWQRLSWRSSSIQWQIASEGLSFVQQTIGTMGGVDDAILRFLLQEASEAHWSVTVKERAKEVLPLLPPVTPAAPKVLRIDAWNRIREAARLHYPKVDFVNQRAPRK